jgi:hypothetical protein
VFCSYNDVDETKTSSKGKEPYGLQVSIYWSKQDFFDTVV